VTIIAHVLYMYCNSYSEFAIDIIKLAYPKRSIVYVHLSIFSRQSLILMFSIAKINKFIQHSTSVHYSATFNSARITLKTANLKR